ncbi:MAG: EamA family transporter [Atribacterota bacterium]
MDKNLSGKREEKIDFRVGLAIVLSLVFWASAFAGIKVGLKGFSPGHLVLLRFLTASVVLLLYAVFTRMPLPEKKDIPALVSLGFIGITVYHVALTYGELKVTAGAASLLIAAAPIFTAILAMFILKEHIRVWGWVGVILSFFGIALVVRGEGSSLSFEPAAFLILLSAICTSVFFVLQKPYLRKYSPLAVTSYAIWAGTLFQLVFVGGLIQSIKVAPVESTMAILYMGVFPAALAYVTWAYVLSNIPASLAGSYLYVSPVLSIFIAWIWLNEVPTFLSLMGGFLALAGVLIVNIWGKR